MKLPTYSEFTLFFRFKFFNFSFGNVVQLAGTLSTLVEQKQANWRATTMLTAFVEPLGVIAAKIADFKLAVIYIDFFDCQEKDCLVLDY